MDEVVKMLNFLHSWSGKKNKIQVLAAKFVAGEDVKTFEVSDDGDQPMPMRTVIKKRKREYSMYMGVCFAS